MWRPSQASEFIKGPFYPGLRSPCLLQPGLLRLGLSAPEGIAGTLHFTKRCKGETVH